MCLLEMIDQEDCMKMVNVNKLDLLLDDLKRDGWKNPSNAIAILVDKKRDRRFPSDCKDGFIAKYSVEIVADGRVYIVGFNKWNSNTFYV